MTQTSASLPIAVGGVLIAAASNNLAKGVYAFILSDRKTGMMSLGLLASLAALGLIPFLWL
jgi:hypothetical protein